MKVSVHLNTNLSKSKKSLLTQLRCGVLPLFIETGRYLNLLRKGRLCPICKTSIKDEIHFLFDCKYYDKMQIELYYKVPELLNVDKMERLRILCAMP